MRARIGFRQGYSVFPMSLVWTLEDVYSEVNLRLEQVDCSVILQEYRFTLLAWANDTWLVAKNAHELEAIIADLRKTVVRSAGLELGIPKRTWPPVQQH